MKNAHTKNNISCEGQLFGHSYLPNGICQKCRGFQNPPLKIMPKLDRVWKENKSGSARAFLISQFLEKLNEGRDGVRYKKLAPARLGSLLAPLKTMEDLRWFWDECKNAKHFSRFFWWKLKK